MNVLSSEHSRRDALKLAGFATLALIVTSGRADATPDEVAAAISKLYGDKKFENGKIKLDVPEIAENGLVVPINLEVESPMTDADHVKAVHVFAEGNPLPNVISYKFTPACGKAAASARMRLAQTQNIVCIAEMSNGNLYKATATIKVTIGGCGG
ncbi:MAG: thiosulfate oxidation carrier protein SoxY [Bradyrhizobium sp.]